MLQDRLWNLIETRMSWSERNVWFVLVFFFFLKHLLQFLFYIQNFNGINEQFPASIKNLPAFYQQLNFDFVILLRQVNINKSIIFLFFLYISYCKLLLLIWYKINWFILKLICYEIPLSIINLIFIAVHTNTITTNYNIAINLTRFP